MRLHKNLLFFSICLAIASVIELVTATLIQRNLESIFVSIACLWSVSLCFITTLLIPIALKVKIKFPYFLATWGLLFPVVLMPLTRLLLNPFDVNERFVPTFHNYTLLIAWIVLPSAISSLVAYAEWKNIYLSISPIIAGMAVIMVMIGFAKSEDIFFPIVYCFVWNIVNNISLLIFSLFVVKKQATDRVLVVCNICGYDLTGLPAGCVCPECGAIADLKAQCSR